jgi:hypothetical protein
VTAAGNESGSSSDSGSSGTTTQEAAQQLENGGDFYFHALFPALYKSGKPATPTGDDAEPTPSSKFAFVVLDPKLGFNFAGFGSQSTITESTEYNFNLSLEGYAQAGSDNGTFVGYFDARSGLQSVQSSYAKSMGLSKGNFLLSSGTIGVQIKGILRIGFQQFFGPRQAFGATTRSDFSKPHFVLQFNPH